MDIFAHFACYTKLPIKLVDVRDHILEEGAVDKIIRRAIPLATYRLLGGFHLVRERDEHGVMRKVARIGYPADRPEGWQRLVQVKEMLHARDPQEATSPTTTLVNQLIDDLISEGTEKAIGLPAEIDKDGILHALAILFPRDALDAVRPHFKRGERTVEQIADEVKLPSTVVAYALTDEWRSLMDRL